MTSSNPNEEQPSPPHAGRRTPRRLPPLLVVAGLLVAAGVGLFLVVSGRSAQNGTTHGATTAAAAGTMPPEHSPSTGSMGPRQGAVPHGDGRAGTVPTLTAAQLGSFADEAGLVRALGAVDPRTLSSAVAASPTSARASANVASSLVKRCEPTARGLLPRPVTNRLAVGVGTVGQRRLLVFSFRTPVTSSSPRGALLVAVDRINCYPVTVHIR